MCCGGHPALTLPGPVAEMLVEYRRLAGQDWLWGETSEHVNAVMMAQLRFVPMAELLGHAFQRAHAAHPQASVQELIERSLSENPSVVLRDILGGRVPEGLLVVRVEAEGFRLEHRGPTPVLHGGVADFSLLVDSALDATVVVSSGGHSEEVGPFGASLTELRWNAGSGCDVRIDGERVDLSSAFVEAEPATLELHAAQPMRWSVVDPSGSAWFPAETLRKWDFHKRPYFHAVDAVLTVPAGTVAVSARRGLEYEVAATTVELSPGAQVPVELDPARRVDPAMAGWYGGDLHVHMNYGGDLVCGPEDAARMQLGEGLHLVNLVAGNCTMSRIFDREALEAWAGQDLAWSGEGTLARMGVEYRNDLLGHFHATGLSAAPSAYHSGHAASERPYDWPANAVAAAEHRALGATVGYCHPVLLPIENDDPSLVFDLMPRSVEAREVVVDAALDLVDSLDVLSNTNGPGAAVLYRHLIGAGRRLAVTAGTDVFLSFSRCATFSNPPGWARVYARTDGPLTMASFQDAVRAGRTVATNGPWIELEVAGQGPGADIEASTGDVLAVRASVRGPGVETLRLLAADGELAATRVDDVHGTLECRLQVGEPTYVVAEAAGGPHPEVLDGQTFAHTSPVYVNCGGRRVQRAADARWCLDWIRRFEDLVRREGSFETTGQLDDLLDVIDRARSIYLAVTNGG